MACTQAMLERAMQEALDADDFWHKFAGDQPRKLSFEQENIGSRTQ